MATDSGSGLIHRPGTQGHPAGVGRPCLSPRRRGLWGNEARCTSISSENNHTSVSSERQPALQGAGGQGQAGRSKQPCLQTCRGAQHTYRHTRDPAACAHSMGACVWGHVCAHAFPNGNIFTDLVIYSNAVNLEMKGRQSQPSCKSLPVGSK